jgi:DNA polymerase V
MLDIYKVSTELNIRIPVVGESIRAGFPSPAEDFSDVSIDLNRELIKNPAATFFGRVRGDSMKDLGIDEGDLLVIDKSLEPADGKLAVCFIDGEFTLKLIRIEENGLWLMPANDKYKPIRVTEESDFEVWGIVVYVIKSF